MIYAGRWIINETVMVTLINTLIMNSYGINLEEIQMDNLKDSLVEVIKEMSIAMEKVAYDVCITEKYAESINKLTFSLSILDDLGIIEKSERSIKISNFLDAVKLYASDNNFNIGHYILKNSDAYIFKDKVCVTGFEINRADTKEKIDDLIKAKFSLLAD